MIYILTHKPVENIEGWNVLQVGDNEQQFSQYRDNTGENISSLNHLYLETTGIYWIWKNDNDDIKGQTQYRRILNINTSSIPQILSKYDIITCVPYIFNPYKQYSACHIESDIRQVRDIMHNLKYNTDDYDRYILNGSKLYYSNGFITTKKLYDDICQFCFNILEEFTKINNFTDLDTLHKHAETVQNKFNNPHKGEITYIEYQSRICGALFERLFTLYILSRQLNVYETPYFNPYNNTFNYKINNSINNLRQYIEIVRK